MSESFGRGESALFLQNPELASAARRQRFAEELLGQAVKPRNVGGHAGGLAQMGQALIAGYMGYREDEKIRAIAEAQRANESEELRALMGGAMPAGQAVPATQSALATPPGSLPPPVPIAPEGGEVPPMATALMNPPGQPAQPGQLPQGGGAQAMPMPPPVPVGGPSAAPAMAQPGGGANMQAIIAGMSSSSPRIRATAQMLFQQARDQEERTLRAQDREEERAFRMRLAGASRAPAAPSEFDRLLQASGIQPGSPEAQQIARQRLLPERAPSAPTEFDRLLGAAGIQPGSPEAQALARGRLERMGQAPQTNVTVAPAEGALIKADTETLKKINEGAQQARAMVNMFTRAEEAVRQVPEGTGAQLLPIIGQTARAFGVDIQGTSEAEVLNSLRNQLASLQRVPGSGANSDLDMALYLQAVPRLGNTREGNLKLIDMGRRLMERRIQEAGVWRRNIGQSDIMEKLDELGPIFSTEERQLLQQDAILIGDQSGGNVTNQRGGFSAAPPAAPPRPGTVLQGFRFRGGNPADRNNWEPAQ